MTPGNVDTSDATPRSDSEAFRLFQAVGRRLTLLGVWVLSVLGFTVISQAIVATVLVGRVPWLVTGGHLMLTSGATVALALRLPETVTRVAQVEASRTEALRVLCSLLRPNGHETLARAVTPVRRRRVRRQPLV